MSAQYRIEVDQSVCQGSGLCAGIAPGHFKIGDDYKSRPLLQIVDADDDVRDAAECCPLEAISLTDPKTGQTLL
ncbi:MAG TPA: ferredoxin [Pseudonocardiaceae bacterium]